MEGGVEGEGCAHVCKRVTSPFKNLNQRPDWQREWGDYIQVQKKGLLKERYK